MTKEIGLEMNMASTLMINTITASLSFSSHSRSHGPHSQPYYTHHYHHHYGRHRSCRPLAPVAVASSATHEIGNSTKTPCRSTPLQKMQARTDSFSMPPEKLAIFKSLDEWVKQNILVLLQPVEKCWQPYDFLPKPESEGFYEQVKELRERCMELSNEYFVVLVGDMISEETLPSYQTLFNAMDGVGDETGSSPSSWATWNRSWSAEENRHGDLLNDYLYLSGRVDMKQIQKTIQYMIRSGWDPKIDKNPYNGYIYASFQERATFISHGNTARLAKQKGDMKLAQLCGTIAADEKRHEIAYSRIVKKFFEMDPDYAVLALANMMKKKIKMPSHLMYDGQDDKLFESYSAIAQWLGVYTTKDYMNILEHFLGFWKVETLTDGLSGEGRRARDYLCGLPPKFRRLEERAQDKAKKQLYAAHGSTTRFSWIFGKQVNL